MIMQFVPESTAMDAFGGPEAHGGEVPREYRVRFYENIACVQVRSMDLDECI